jgi:ABC-type multidrug transport system fused ATPase/permease subunit
MVFIHKTRVFITNSLNFLQFTDKIIFLNNGRISEIGTYEELAQKDGEFCNFTNKNQKQEITSKN